MKREKRQRERDREMNIILSIMLEKENYCEYEVRKKTTVALRYTDRKAELKE